MSNLAPLAMSQTKDELLKHLGMNLEIYNTMAKEADRTYKWLMSGECHLKKNCKRKPPYDWSDIVEKSKDEALQRIAQSGDETTSCYWDLAEPTVDCPNWIARWFLYHKFRYRDGRNRNSVNADEGRHSHQRHSSNHHRQGHQLVDLPENGYCNEEMSHYPAEDIASGSNVSAYEYEASANMNEYNEGGHLYTYQDNGIEGYKQQQHNDTTGSNAYYDPVRDARM